MIPNGRLSITFDRNGLIACMVIAGLISAVTFYAVVRIGSTPIK